MNWSLKYFLSFVLFVCAGAIMPSTSAVVTAVAAPTVPAGKNPEAGYWYTDEFGPLQSNYSMGDFVRYTANKFNVYYNSVHIPYADDIKKYGLSRNNPRDMDHLYNFVGYLYAGYAALNINPSTLMTPNSNWLSKFRTKGQGQAGSLGLFDNNKACGATIQLVDYSQKNPKAYSSIAGKGGYGWYVTTDAIDAWYGFGNMAYVFLYYNKQHSFRTDNDYYFSETPTIPVGLQDSTGNLVGAALDVSMAANSCAWSTNVYSWDFVLAMPTKDVVPGVTPKYWSNNHQNVAAPYGQFFGARLSHILGAVLNDIPSTNATNPFMPTGTYQPQMAKMHGYKGSTTGLTTPSTAHFGSLKNFLASVNIPPRLKVVGSYLNNHIAPTVARLASVCSYGLSVNNLIQISPITEVSVPASVTAYDNGVIVAIENNTGDQLTVHQTTASNDDHIGTLPLGVSNHFLHTASMMSAATPVIGNMIELYDKKAALSVYMQLVSAQQLQTIITNFNAALNTVAKATTDTMAYNQGIAYSPSTTAAYLLISNFNPTTIATSTVDENEFLMYRMQAINLAEFELQPYFVTLKIDKEKIGYGVGPEDTTVGAPIILNPGTAQTSMLYPSIVSVKTCSWQNPFAKQLNAGANPPTYYSAVPLLLMPETVLQANIAGLKSHYGIWLMAYAAALTEFQFNCKFGDNLDCLQNTFGLFDVVKQQAPARVVIDGQGILQSGQYVATEQSIAQSLQSTATYGALMGCDVWDLGQDFHQDIPILNLYQDARGNVATNQSGGDFVNFYVNVGNAKPVDTPASFAQGYGTPYNNRMLYSLQTSTLQQGVIGQLTQTKAGKYQLIFTDRSNNVLCVQKVSVDQKTQTMTPITVGFLNNQGASWSATVQLPANIASVGVGKTKQFVLTYKATSTTNNFQVSDIVASKK